MRADERQLLDEQLGHLGFRVVHADEACQLSAVENQRGNAAADALCLEDGILDRHCVLLLLQIADEDVLAFCKLLQPVRHLLWMQHILRVRRNAVPVPPCNIAVIAVFRSVEQIHAVAFGVLADIPQGFGNDGFHLKPVAHLVHDHHLSQKRACALPSGRYIVVKCRLGILFHRFRSFLFVPGGKAALHPLCCTADPVIL